MDDSTKSSRLSWIKGLNFGGATDWATDLDKFVEAGDGDGDGDGDTDPEDVCKPTDRTYSTEVAPAGKFMRMALLDPELILDTGTRYITIVNLTPHRFVFDQQRTHSNLFDKFDFSDIPPG